MVVVLKLSLASKRSFVFRTRKTILENYRRDIDRRYHDRSLKDSFTISLAGKLLMCEREYKGEFYQEWVWTWRHEGKLIFYANISGSVSRVNKKEIHRECRELLLGLAYGVPPMVFPNERAKQLWELLKIDCCTYWDIPFMSYIKKEDFVEAWKQTFKDSVPPPIIKERLWKERRWWL